MPARPAMATRWIMALVEPASALCTTRAFSTARRSMMSEGLRSSQIISTMRRPQAEAMRGCAASPGRDRGRAGQGEPKRLGDGGHGRGRAHGHAGAGRTGDAGLHVVPLLDRDGAGLFL